MLALGITIERPIILRNKRNNWGREVLSCPVPLPDPENKEVHVGKHAEKGEQLNIIEV